VALLLESSASIQSRRAQARARIIASASLRSNESDALQSIQNIVEKLGNQSTVYTSANNTWIDRTESAAIQRVRPSARIRSVYPQVPELFSAGPLACIAAGLSERSSFSVLCTSYNGTVAGASLELQT
jgi:hypothetical protein